MTVITALFEARPGCEAKLEAALRELVGKVAAEPGALRDGFVVSAATLRHFQADPLLPAATRAGVPTAALAGVDGSLAFALVVITTYSGKTTMTSSYDRLVTRG